MAYPILISTVGTSLFKPNLEGLKRELDENRIRPERRALAEAYRAGDMRRVAAELRQLSSADRICGAEINSIASLIEKGHVQPDCGLYFLHSETEDGRLIAEVLKAYYQQGGHQPVSTVEVADLQDQDPKRFRTKGLRHLAREIAAVVRNHSANACAINATGGYKAQIAIGVVLGQALGATVFYKHEHFSEIISFPPLPIALDFEVWMRASGLLYDLTAQGADFTPAARYADEWDEKFESLVERVSLDGQEFLELSPTGAIFHETFDGRFRSARDLVLPSPAPGKRPPRLERSGWTGEHPEVEQFLQRVTDHVPFVVHTATFYYNPDLPERTRFTLGRGDVVGVFSDGRYCVKFRVETTAQTAGQRSAAVAGLNAWLIDRDFFLSRDQADANYLKEELAEIETAWGTAEQRVQQLQRQNEQLLRQNQDLSAQAELAEEEQRRLSEAATQLQAELQTSRSATEEARRAAAGAAERLRICEQKLAAARVPWWRRLLGGGEGDTSK
jgi:putative CRISPR-associated protein (TIGR02619 family)